jgi:hypothetical protein
MDSFTTVRLTSIRCAPRSLWHAEQFRLSALSAGFLADAARACASCVNRRLRVGNPPVRGCQVTGF